MHEPRTLYVPGELLQNLARSGVDCLRGKSLITEVLSCPSYAMYLSAGSESIFLHFTTDILHVL